MNPALALPMGSQGSWMMMGDRTPDSIELAVNFAITRQDALGVATGRWEERPHAGAPRPHALRREFSGWTYTRLLNRWNLPHAQANLWFVGTAGWARARERSVSEGMGAWSLMADHETTRVYTGAAVESMRSQRLRHDTASARAGFSFYEVDYEDVQPWLVVEFKRERTGAEAKNTVTPLLRLIHRRYFLELGGHREGATVNVMYNF